MRKEIRRGVVGLFVFAVFAAIVVSIANAGEVFFREHDEDSVIVGPICVPDIAGVLIESTVDFDLASLVITITPNTAVAGFNYTGGNIDDYDGTPPAWGNPTTSAIEVEQVTTGANDGCVILHLRDEVLAVASASEWTISFTDGGSAIMDHTAQILATLGATDIEAQVDTGLDTFIVEDEGATYDLDCAIAILLSIATGPYTVSGGTQTFQDPGANENRSAAALTDTTRGNPTITCP